MTHHYPKAASYHSATITTPVSPKQVSLELVNTLGLIIIRKRISRSQYSCRKDTLKITIIFNSCLDNKALIIIFKL